MRILVLFSVLAVLPVIYKTRELDVILSTILLGASLGILLKLQTDNDECLSWMFDRPWKILLGGIILGALAFVAGVFFQRPWLWIAGAGFVAAMAAIEAFKKRPPQSAR